MAQPGSTSTLGMLQQVAQALPQVGADDLILAQCSEGEDMANLIMRTIRMIGLQGGCTVSDAALAQIGEVVRQRTDDWERYYAAAAVGMVAVQNLRPNASVTLYGPDPATSATYAGNTTIPLTPRLAGAVQPAFSMNEKQSFYRLTTQKVDIDKGWRFVGNTVQFTNQIVSSMRFDTSFGDFDERGDAMASPLAVFQFRSPKNTVQFTASAAHNQTAAQTLECGVTLEYYDTACRNETDLFLDSAYDLSYAGAIAWFIERRRQSCIHWAVKTRPGMPTGQLPPAPPGFPSGGSLPPGIMVPR